MVDLWVMTMLRREQPGSRFIVCGVRGHQVLSVPDRGAFIPVPWGLQVQTFTEE